jgi:amidase
MQLHSDADYTAVWNGLDYATAVFPVSTVHAAVDMKKPPHAFLSEADKRNYELCALWTGITADVFSRTLTLLPDDPNTFKGAPIGLQLVGRTLEEEAVIAMTEIVDAAVKDFLGSEGTSPDLKADKM